MNKPKPLVSILMPVNNAQDHLYGALESILLQKYQNIEVIAIDDDSKDNSLKILRKFRKTDKRIKIHKNLNKYGLRASLNLALKKSKGEFIAFMPEDGRNYVDRVGKQVSFLLNNPQVAVVGSQCTFVNKNGKVVSKTSLPTHPDKLDSNLTKGGPFIFGSLMINKLALPKDLLYFEYEEKPAIFAAILMKACKYTKIANLEEALIFCPEHFSPFNRNIDLENIVSHVKAWANAFLVHEYRPSLRSILTL